MRLTKRKHWTIARSLLVVVPTAAVMGGIEAALIIALRISRNRNVRWPLILMAVLAAVLLAAGVLRHYWDIYKHRTVRGISFIFVGIDATGDLTSLVSVLFQPELDVIGMVIYGTEFVLWLGVFAAGGYYNLLPWTTKQLGRHRSRQRQQQQELAAEAAFEPGNSSNRTALHDLPSSTSVFRTPSSDAEVVRSRRTVSAIP